MLENILEALDFTPEEVRIYLLILESGSSTAGELAKKAGIARPTLYGMLQKLTDKGIINRSLKYGVRNFSAIPPEKLDKMFQEKIERLEIQRIAYKKILPDLISKSGFSITSPKFQFFEGVEGVQQVLKDMLMYHDCDTMAFWPIKSMIEMLSKDFFHYHNVQRIRNNLYTRAIWPVDEAVDVKLNPFLGVGEDFKREIRIAPTNMHFTMGYWMYKNRAAFLSSKAENFGFIIESQEMVDMLKAKFEVVWQISKKLEVDPNDTKDFINEVYR